MNMIEQLEQEEAARVLGDKNIPDFSAGDTLRVQMRPPIRRWVAPVSDQSPSVYVPIRSESVRVSGRVVRLGLRVGG